MITKNIFLALHWCSISRVRHLSQDNWAYASSMPIVPFITMKELSFEELFVECFYPIWNYGKEDRYIQDALFKMSHQLLQCDIKQENQRLLQNFKEKIKLQMSSREK